MSLHRLGLASMGSLLLPEAQEKRLDTMRRDTLDRIDATAKKVSGAMLVTGGITALSTALLVTQAYKMRRGR
jgi:hypothetical protein